jgi:hypothetical protein
MFIWVTLFHLEHEQKWPLGMNVKESLKNHFQPSHKTSPNVDGCSKVKLR